MLLKFASSSTKSRKPSFSRRISLYMSWKSLSSKKLRSFLTVSGVSIGLGAIFFLLSLGFGLQSIVTDEVIGNQSVKTVDVTSPNSTVIQLNLDNLNKIKNLPNVDSAAGLLAGSGIVQLETSQVDSVLFGVDQNYQEIANLTAVKGRLFKNDDTNKAIVNKAILTAIGIDDINKAVGKKLDIKIVTEVENQDTPVSTDVQLTIVGVIDSGSGSEVYVPSSVLAQAKINTFMQAKVVSNDVKYADDIRKQIESMGLETLSPLDTISQIQQLFRYLNYALVGFGSIGMIVAVLGMFNTLTISLLERTREIGLMIALGVRNKDVRRLFVYESLLLSLIGSLLGILLAFAGGVIINIVMNGVAQSRGFDDSFNIFVVPWWLPPVSIAFMLAVGIGVSFFPARRAERINPIDALRDE